MKNLKINLTLTVVIMFLILCVAGCSQEEDQVQPQPTDEPSELQELIAPEPELVDPPVIGETIEDIFELPFPEDGNAGGRVNAAGVMDYVDFDDPFSLSLIPDQAKHFAAWPYYIQAVGNAWIHVKENNGAGYNPAFTSNYNHYHLGYEDFEPCTQPDYDLGKPYGSGTGCIDFNPLQERRVLATHYGNQWIKIYAYDYEQSHRVFEFWGITVMDGPVQVWMRRPDGSWFKWSSLKEAKWSFNYARVVTQILIAGVDASPITIDDLKIKMPYN